MDINTALALFHDPLAVVVSGFLFSLLIRFYETQPGTILGEVWGLIDRDRLTREDLEKLSKLAMDKVMSEVKKED